MKKTINYALQALLLFVSLLAGQAVSGEAVTYYHHDNLGSIVAASDGVSGALKWREQYQPYGERLLKEGDSENSIWFAGKTEEIGLNYFGARWYDPELGRFLASDPVDFHEENPQSFNRYAYANNNPYKFVDPDGELPILLVFIFKEAASEAFEQYTGIPVPSVKNLLKFGSKKLLKKAAKKGASKTCSFAPETPVLTSKGYRSIIEVVVGDEVLARNDETGSLAWQEVTDWYRHWHDNIIEFEVVDSEGNKETITTTTEHPFYLVDKGWTPAGDLTHGSMVASTHDGEWIRIESINQNLESQYAYNLTVDSDHTFFVGRTNLWVHNACDPSKATKETTKKLSKVKKEVRNETLGDGKFTKKTKIIPGKGPGQSRSEMEFVKNADGKLIRARKFSYDRANKLQHKKRVRGGPDGRGANDNQ